MGVHCSHSLSCHVESKLETYTQYLRALGRGTCLSTPAETWNIRDLSSKGGATPAWTSDLSTTFQSCFLLAAGVSFLSSSAHGHSHSVVPQSNIEGQYPVVYSFLAAYHWPRNSGRVYMNPCALLFGSQTESILQSFGEMSMFPKSQL